MVIEPNSPEWRKLIKEHENGTRTADMVASEHNAVEAQDAQLLKDATALPGTTAGTEELMANARRRHQLRKEIDRLSDELGALDAWRHQKR